MLGSTRHWSRRACCGWLGLSLAAVAPCTAWAAEPEGTDGTDDFHRDHRRTQIGGMSVLTGWAIANIGGGIAGALLVEGDRRFVHEMNAMWNTVNLTLGIVGLATQARRKPGPGRSDAHDTYRRTRRTYFVNGMLDVLYISGGVATAELGRRYGSARARGYGSAVVFQGAFLLLFDLGMLLAHERVAARVPKLRIVPHATARAFGLVATTSF